MSNVRSFRSNARARSLRWIEALWEGANTTAREEDRKEEVIEVFRELVKDSRSRREVHEYVPWQQRWLS